MIFATVSARPTAKGLEYALHGASAARIARLESLPLEDLKRLQADLGKAQLTPAEYADKFEQLLEDLQARFDELADLVAGGDISSAQFRHRAERALKSGYIQAYRYGSGAIGDSPTLEDADLTAIADAFAEDKEYLQRFADQIAQGYVPITPEDRVNVEGTMLLSDRANLYANSVRELYFRGYVAGAPDGDEFEWQLGDTDHCDPCLDAADGSPYTADDLPGMPGEICDGGSRCGCELQAKSMVQSEEDETAAAG